MLKTIQMIKQMQLTIDVHFKLTSYIFRPVGRGWGVDGFDAANRLTTSIQSPCVAITAGVEAISLSGPAFWRHGVKIRT